MSQGNLQATQPDNETTNSCSESFVGDEPLRPETQEEVSVSPASTSTFTGEGVQSEPRVSVPQRARKPLNTALLNVEQQKLDYLKQKMKGNRTSFPMKMSVFSKVCFLTFSSSPCVQTGSGTHPASYPMGTGGKARPWRDADHSPPSSAEVKNE
jgi:hypothetical protein